MEIEHYNLLILGSGPAGCTAAIYAARAGINFAMITGPEPGGQLIKTPRIANWPGEKLEISGMELMDKMLNQVQKFSTNVISDTIEKADLTTYPFHLTGNSSQYSCDALIIATGVSPMFLGLPSEQKYIGRGVTTCATCDGFFYKNQDVIVVGGGNTAIEEALYLATIAKSVTIVYRRSTPRAEEVLITQAKNTPNISWELNSIVEEILGNEQGVTGAIIKNLDSQTTKELTAPGIFIAIGHKPNTEILAQQLELENGYIKTGYNAPTATNIPGVFASGDIIANSYHQAIVAAGSGCVATLDAKNFLQKKQKN
jgi:thioredoxin reductase (NADPH)